MADDLPTRQDLVDFKTDIADLGTVANGPEGESVTMRLGEVVPTLATMIAAIVVQEQNATAAATLAGQYANYPVDQEIPDHAGEFSGLHYNSKTSDVYDDALVVQQQVNAALTLAEERVYTPFIAGSGPYTGTAYSGLNTLIWNEPFPTDLILRTLYLYGVGAGTGGTLRAMVVRYNEYGNWDLVWDFTAQVGNAGDIAIDLGGFVAEEGDYLAINRAGSTSASLGTSAGGVASMFQVTSKLTGNDNAATNSNTYVHYRLEADEPYKLADVKTDTDRLLASIGSDFTDLVDYSIGRYAAAINANASSENIYFPPRKLQAGGFLKALSFQHIEVGGSFQVYIMRPAGTGEYDYTYHDIFTVRTEDTGPVTLLRDVDFQGRYVGKYWRVGFRPIDATFGYMSGGGFSSFQLNSAFVPVIGDTATLVSSNTAGIDFEVTIEATDAVLSRIEDSLGERNRGTTTLAKHLFRGTGGDPDWTLAGANPFTWNDGLRSPATGGWGTFAYFEEVNWLDRRTIMTKFTINTASSAIRVDVGNNGTQGGKLMLNCTTQQLEYYTWTGGATAGTLIFAEAITGLTDAPGTVAGRRYALTWKQDLHRHVGTLTDLYTGETADPIVYDTTHLSESFAHGAAGVGFTNGSGGVNDVTINYFHFSADVCEEPFIVWIGDSNWRGNDALGDIDYRSIPELFEETVRQRGDTITCARWGATSAQLKDNIAWLSRFRPKYVFFQVGTNPDAGDAHAVWLANMAIMIDYARYTGAIPIVGTLFPKTVGGIPSTVVAANNASIRAYELGDVDYVDFSLAMSDNRDMTYWATGFDAGDDVHSSNLGNLGGLAQLLVEAPYLLEGSLAGAI